MNIEKLLKIPKFNIETIKTYEHGDDYYIKISDLANFIGGHAQSIARQIKKQQEKDNTTYIESISALNGNCIKVSLFESAVREQTYNVDALIQMAEQSKVKAKDEIVGDGERIVKEETFQRLVKADDEKDRLKIRVETLQYDLERRFTENELLQRISEAEAKVRRELTNEKDAAIKRLRDTYDEQVDELYSKATLDLKIKEAEDKLRKDLETIHESRKEIALDNLRKELNKKIKKLEDSNTQVTNQKSSSIDQLNNEHQQAIDDLNTELESVKNNNKDLEGKLYKTESDLLDTQLSNTTQNKTFLSRIATDPIFQSVYLLMVIFGTISIGYFELYSSFTGNESHHFTSGVALIIVSICLGLALVWTAYNVPNGFWKYIAIFIFAMCEWSSFSSFIELEKAFPMNIADMIRQLKLASFSLLLPVLTVLLSKSGGAKKSMIEIVDSIDDLINTLQSHNIDNKNVVVNSYKQLLLVRAEANNVSPIIELYKKYKERFLNWWNQ